MKSQRLKQIEEIYHAVLEIEPARRDKFLVKRCNADEDLRREVESLLSFERTSDNFLDDSPESLAAEMFSEYDEPASLIGANIGHYQIIKLLGRGGMGEVYLAEDTRLDRRIAVKFLRGEFVLDARKLDRFRREAKAASALNHPNILTVYEIGESNDLHYIATEFIEGEVLNYRASVDQKTFGAILDIAIQIVSALKTAHEAGIVHRDIKPDNVMIRKDGIVKVLDFGLAKLLPKRGDGETGMKGEDEAKLTLSPHPSFSFSRRPTEPGIIMGTLNYMSPEQARGSGITHQTDIFSFGIVLYEMLAGKMPFDGESAMDVIGAILHKEPLPLNELMPELPGDIIKIVNKSLCKNAGGRYQNTNDLLTDLRRAKQRLDYEETGRSFPPDSFIRNSETGISGSSSSPAQKTPAHHDLSATHDSAGISNTKATNLPTDGALEFQTTALTANVSPNIKISRSDNFLSNLNRHRRKIFVSALLIFLIAAGAFFDYRNFTANKQIDSIAVMPFVNASGNNDLDYLSDGMTETLIGSLTQIPNLNVKARSAVFRYKGADFDSRKIGATLNVRAILTGRIVQRGDQIILNLELIDAPTENVLWSRSYERKSSEIVLLQSDIARDVSSNLKIRLSGAEEKNITKPPTSDPEAYQAYLKGRYYWNRRTAENLTKAIEQFRIAADRAPNYALAFSGLADCYAVLNEYAAIPASQTIPQAKDFAARAIALDANLAEPHVSLGLIYGRLWQWADAEQEYQQAIALNPNYPTAFHWYSILLRDLGRFDESAVMIKRAHELDPLSSIISINVSQVYQAQNDWNASVENTLKIIELDPNYSGAYNNLALSYLKLGRGREAVANFEKAVELGKRADVVLRNLGYAYAVVGRRAEALALAKELEEKYAKKNSLGMFVAAVYSGLGDKDKVFEWLEKDFRNREDLASVRWSPQFESILGDPRYEDLLRRMNLPIPVAQK